jgi:O-antigen/teichoic acid export membrane protein
MIIRGAAQFFSVKLITGFFGLLGMIGLVRGYGTDGFGAMMLMTSWSSLLRLTVFSWILKSISRYCDLSTADGERTVIALANCHCGIFFLLIIISVLTSFFIEANYLPLIVLLATADSNRECDLEIEKANSNVSKYAIKTSFWAVLNASLAWSTQILRLPWTDFLALNSLISCLVFFNFPLRVGKSYGALKTIGVACRYGFPAALADTISHAGFIVVRLSIGYSQGLAALGWFVALYEFVQRFIVSYMQVVNSVMFPILRRARDASHYSMYLNMLRVNFFLLVTPTLILISHMTLFFDYILASLNLQSRLQGESIFLILGISCFLNRLRAFNSDSMLLFAHQSSILLRNAIVSLVIISVASIISLTFDRLLIPALGLLLSTTSALVLSEFACYKASHQKTNVYDATLLGCLGFITILLSKLFSSDSFEVRILIGIFVLLFPILLLFFIRFPPLWHFLSKEIKAT